MIQIPRRLLRQTLFFWAATAFAGAAWALTPEAWQHTQPLAVPQTGLIFVRLPVATSDAAQPDLRDLRLLDGNGREVPFVFQRATPESSAAPLTFQSAIDAASSKSSVTLRTGSTQPLAAVELSTPATHFVKAVTVETSDDGVHWAEVDPGKPIFRYPGNAENLRIDLPAKACAYLRLTMDDRRAEPIPLTGARLIFSEVDQAHFQPLPMKIKSRDESAGLTRLSVDLGAANLLVSSIKLTVNEHVFTRAVSVAEPEVQEHGLGERVLAEGSIYRIDFEGINEARLTIPVEQQVMSRELLLVIHNHDSPPLAIDGVEGIRREVWIAFYAAAPGTYTLLTGNSECQAPTYDLSGLREKLQNAAAVPLEPGPLADNPGYHPPEALGSLTLKGGAIDAGKWSFRKPLPVAKPGAQQVELDADTMEHASADFRDIRIVQGDRQVPFILERTSITRAVPLSAALKLDPARPSRSLWELKLPQPLPLADITCASSSPLFERSLRLWEDVADDQEAVSQRELGGAVWKRTPGDGQSVFFLPLSARPQTALLKLETDSGDNAAIELNTFEGHYPVTRAIFKAGGNAEPIWLLYGNAEAGFPSYDLQLVAGDLLRAERGSLTAGAQQRTVATAPAEAAQALAGASRYLFWGVLALVVIALLGITAKLLPKEPLPPAG